MQLWLGVNPPIWTKSRKKSHDCGPGKETGRVMLPCWGIHSGRSSGVALVGTSLMWVWSGKDRFRYCVFMYLALAKDTCSIKAWCSLLGILVFATWDLVRLILLCGSVFHASEEACFLFHGKGKFSMYWKRPVFH